MDYSTRLPFTRRNLIDFLYSRSKRKDKPTDIVIEDYADEATIAQHLLPITPLLDSAIIKAHKQVAHITKERVDFEREGKEWRVHCRRKSSSQGGGLSRSSHS